MTAAATRVAALPPGAPRDRDAHRSAAAPPPTAPPPAAPPITGRAAPWHERVIEALLLACAVVSILTTAGIVLVLLSETVRFFAEVSLLDFLTDTEWTPLFTDKHYGIWPLLTGTLLTSAIALAVAVPFGLLAAVYLSELAHPRVRRVVKPALELLAGVPTVVYGYFALVVLTPLLQGVVPDLGAFNALSPGIVMGAMIVPLVSSLSEDALHAVPQSLREGAYALGAGKLATIFRVVLPTARSGIAASVTLAASRAVGETMIVAIAAGQQPRFGLDPRQPLETMTAYIVKVSLGDIAAGTTEFRTIFAVGSALFVMTLLMNLLSLRLARSFRGSL